MERIRHLGLEVLLVQLIVLLCITYTAAEARAACGTAGAVNWAVGAGPTTGVTNSKGVFGWSHVNDNLDIGTNDIHVESLYIWHDGDDMVEYGWDFDRGDLFTNKHVFDARTFAGDYAVRLDDYDPTVANHSFRIIYNDSTDRYDFKYDGDTQNYHRDPTWVSGRPWAVGEISDHSGTSHWWTLRYLGANWNPWSGTHWNCDTETHHGYLEISNTEFRVQSVSDTFAGPCDQFD